MEELKYTDSDLPDAGLGRGVAASYFHISRQTVAESSHTDPHEAAAFDPQEAPFQRPPRDAAFQGAAFDRFNTLVEACWQEACASTPTLNAPEPSSSCQVPLPAQHLIPVPNDPFRLAPSLYSMVRAPSSDAEEESGSSLPSFGHDEPVTPTRNPRRHACKMCDKAFDRPSTLKTHLLVHTGVTPFSCHLCGRRFGVQSNCNRHMRRCAIRGQLFLARRLEFEEMESGQPYPSSAAGDLTQAPPRSESCSPSPPALPKPKRRRRKRSPAPAWIPNSLASFTLANTCPPVPVPLPPVTPRTEYEERDSYVTCHDQPYTEEGWSGRLPGPAPLFESTAWNSDGPRRRSTSRR